MTCGACGSTRVYPSRLRNAYERVRVALSTRQPHRCHECGWRKWRVAEILKSGEPATRPEDLRTGHGAATVKPTDLDELDPIRSRR